MRLEGSSSFTDQVALKMKRALPKASSSPSVRACGALMRGPNEAASPLFTKTPLVEPRSRTIQAPSAARYSSPCCREMCPDSAVSDRSMSTGPVSGSNRPTTRRWPNSGISLPVGAPYRTTSRRPWACGPLPGAPGPDAEPEVFPGVAGVAGVSEVDGFGLAVEGDAAAVDG